MTKKKQKPPQKPPQKKAKAIGLSKTPPKSDAKPLGQGRTAGRQPVASSPRAAGRQGPVADPAPAPAPAATAATAKAREEKRPRPVGVPNPKPKPAIPAEEIQQTADALLDEIPGSYREHPVLAELPMMITAQQAMKARIAAVAPIVIEEKAIREQMEALILVCDLPEKLPNGKNGEWVTCGDYKVNRVKKPGQTKIDGGLLTAWLLDHEWDTDEIAACLKAVTVTGEPSSHVEVRLTTEARKRLQAQGLAVDEEDDHEAAS